VTGATVHFVDAGVDTGPILAQAPVPVLDDDTVETLRARILREEHRLLVGAVHAVATGRARVEGRRVRFA
jgi:phosphoribosylglycinamide formyltransferase-1